MSYKPLSNNNLDQKVPAAAFQAAAVIGCAVASDFGTEPGTRSLE
jgi:hypothetical protein